MKIIDWIGNIFGKNDRVTLDSVCSFEYSKLQSMVFAEIVAKDMISRSMSMLEFKTYLEGKLTRGENYYMLNVEPNPNESASEFWGNVALKLLEEKEVLIIQSTDGKTLRMADSFSRTEYALIENSYTDVVIKGYQLSDVFKESQVLYISLDNMGSNMALRGIGNSYDGLISSTDDGLKLANKIKAKVTIPTNLPQNEATDQMLHSYFGEQMKTFLDPNTNAVLPERNGLNFQLLSSDRGGGSSKNYQSDRTIRNLMDDVFDYVAMAYGIPTKLFKTDISETKDIFDLYITNCIDPLIKLITDEVNRKLYPKKDFLNKTYAKVDTSNLRLSGLTQQINRLEVLTRNGINSLDDNLIALDREPIGGEEGEQRFITKNYDSFENMTKKEENNG